MWHTSTHNTSSVGNIDALPPALQAEVRAEVNNAVFWAYVSILPFLSLAGALVFLLGNVKITAQKQNSRGEIDGTQNVENTPYLWWLATAKAAWRRSKPDASRGARGEVCRGKADRGYIDGYRLKS
jgi:hypothetical protein